MHNKGIQRERLYRNRHLEKMRRRKQKRLHRYPRGVFAYATCDMPDGIVGANYMKVVKCLDKNYFELSALKYRPKRVELIQIPKVFSIAENPETVIHYLRRLYTIGKGKKTQMIKFDHSSCERLGLSASTILDIIVLAMDRYRETIRKPMDYNGVMPKSKPAKDILLASGLPYHLRADYTEFFDEEHIERFETVSGVYDENANRADGIATKLTEYFNRCLKTQNYELNSKGLSRLSNMLGEVITNCEIHGGEGSTWYTQGHYQIPEGNSYGEI